MKYFLDTEFHEYRLNGTNTIELISIGIVREDGLSYYGVCKDFETVNAWHNEWLRENVLKPIWYEFSAENSFHFELIGFHKIIETYGSTGEQIRSDVLKFIGFDKPEFYGYYADYDWVVFCWLFGRMIDLPPNFPMYCRDLKQMFDGIADYVGPDKLKNHPNYPKQENEHNALDDAVWNLNLFNFLIAYSAEMSKKVLGKGE